MIKLALTVPGPGDGYKLDPVANMPSGGFSLLRELITWATTTLMIGATLLCILIIIFGGIRIITSGGDKAGLEAGRNLVIYAIVGLVIIFLSFFILGTIQTIFDIKLLGGIG